MKKHFNTLIVRRPCAAMVDGITSADLGKPNYELALEQHNNYIEVLKTCDVQVEILDEMPEFPDSTFIEDVAVCTEKCAIVTNPGAASRNGETAGIEQVLSKYYKNIEQIQSPGTLEGGDIMMVGNHYYIGISARTNHAGADQLISILGKYGMTGSKVELNEVLHLKTGLSYLENNNLLVAGEFLKHEAFKDFNKIIINPAEAYSANSIWVNNTILTPKGYPNTLKQLKNLDYRIVELDLSEFRKLDGGLSCLSLRF